MIQTREIGPTEGSGFSTAGIHKMQESPPPGGKPRAHRLRAYTPGEEKLIRKGIAPGDHSGRFEVLAISRMIDGKRYEDAGLTAPDVMTEDGLTYDKGLEGWYDYYRDQYGVDVAATVVSAEVQVENVISQNNGLRQAA